MANSQINWRKGDYISLGKAVSQFNRKINELQKEEKRNYLPELINYKDINGLIDNIVIEELDK